MMTLNELPEVIRGVKQAYALAGRNPHASMFLARLAEHGLAVVDGATLEALVAARELAKEGSRALSEASR